MFIGYITYKMFFLGFILGITVAYYSLKIILDTFFKDYLIKAWSSLISLIFLSLRIVFKGISKDIFIREIK